MSAFVPAFFPTFFSTFFPTLYPAGKILRVWARTQAFRRNRHFYNIFCCFITLSSRVPTASLALPYTRPICVCEAELFVTRPNIYLLYTRKELIQPFPNHNPFGYFHNPSQTTTPTPFSPPNRPVSRLCSLHHNLRVSPHRVHHRNRLHNLLSNRPPIRQVLSSCQSDDAHLPLGSSRRLIHAKASKEMNSLT